MATKTAKQASIYKPSVVSSEAGEVYSVRGEWDVAVDGAGVAPALNDVIQMVKLPAMHVIVDAILDSDDLDSSTNMQMTAAVLNAAGDDISSDVLISASTVGQTGGVVRPTLAAAFRIAPDPVNERYVGIKIIAAGNAVTGKIGLTMLYRASYDGA